MKKLLLGFLLLTSATSAFSQNNTIEGKWQLPGLENTLYIFENGVRFTYYCTSANCDSLYNTFEAGDGNHIPGVEEYTVTNDTLTMDFNFGDILVIHLTFSCEGNIVTFGDSNGMFYIRLGTNLSDCSLSSLAEQTQNSSLMDGIYYDLLGREIVDLVSYPVNSIYIRNGKKFLKTEK
jgi:hypothetical protein